MIAGKRADAVGAERIDKGRELIALEVAAVEVLIRSATRDCSRRVGNTEV
jgi:hypothetical protein